MPPGQKSERHGSVTAVFPIRNGAGVRSRSPRGGRVARRPSSKQSKKCRVLVVILLCLFIHLFKETATLAGQPSVLTGESVRLRWTARCGCPAAAPAAHGPEFTRPRRRQQLPPCSKMLRNGQRKSVSRIASSSRSGHVTNVNVPRIGSVHCPLSLARWPGTRASRPTSPTTRR